MCRDWSALIGFTAMAKLTRKLHSSSTSSYMFLSQYQGEEFLPAKTYSPLMAAKRGYVLIDVADDDYYGEMVLYSVAIRRDQARRLRADLSAHYKAVHTRRQKLAPLLDVGLDDIPF